MPHLKEESLESNQLLLRVRHVGVPHIIFTVPKERKSDAPVLELNETNNVPAPELKSNVPILDLNETNNHVQDPRPDEPPPAYADAVEIVRKASLSKPVVLQAETSHMPTTPERKPSLSRLGSVTLPIDTIPIRKPSVSRTEVTPPVTPTADPQSTRKISVSRTPLPLPIPPLGAAHLRKTSLSKPIVPAETTSPIESPILRKASLSRSGQATPPIDTTPVHTPSRSIPEETTPSVTPTQEQPKQVEPIVVPIEIPAPQPSPPIPKHVTTDSPRKENEKFHLPLEHEAISPSTPRTPRFDDEGTSTPRLSRAETFVRIFINKLRYFVW